MDYHSCSISFLDVKLHGSDAGYTSALYWKPTAGNGLLHAGSCHPPYTVENLPIGKYVCAKRTCSNDAIFLQEFNTIKTRLFQRRYSHSLLHTAKNIVDGKHCDHYLFFFTKKDNQ